MLLDTTAIRQKFNLEQNALANQIAAASSIAALSIREVVSSEVYAEAVGSAVGEENSNYIRQSKVIQSHAYLTYYFLLKDSSNKFGSSGIIKEAQDAKSVEGNTITNKYLTPAELEQMKDDALASAKFFLSSYGTLLIDEEVVVAAARNAFESTLKWF